MSGDQNSTVVDVESETRSRPPALGTLLEEAGFASRDQVGEAMREGLRTGEKLGEVVIRRGWATEEQIAQLLANQWDLRYKRADELSIDPLAIRKLSRADAQQLNAVPVWFESNGLVMAVSEPAQELFDAVQNAVGANTYVVVTRSALESLLQSHLFPDGRDAARQETAVSINHTETQASESPSGYEALDSATGDALATGDAPGSDEGSTGNDTDTAHHEDVNVDQLLSTITGSSKDLDWIHRRVAMLGESLDRTREQLAERDAQLEAAETTSARDAETISKLESELAEGKDIFNALKEKVTDLKHTLDGGAA